MSDPYKEKVLEAALAWAPTWDGAEEGITAGNRLSDAVRAYRKSLEPRERYVVVRSSCAEFGSSYPIWCIHDTHGPSLPNNYEPTCRRPEDAERIAALLNREEGSER